MGGAIAFSVIKAIEMGNFVARVLRSPVGGRRAITGLNNAVSMYLSK